MADRPRHGLGDGRPAFQGGRDGDVSLVAWGGRFASGEARRGASVRWRNSARGPWPRAVSGPEMAPAAATLPWVAALTLSRAPLTERVALVLVLPPQQRLSWCCHDAGCGSTPPLRTFPAPPSTPPTCIRILFHLLIAHHARRTLVTTCVARWSL